MSVIVWRGTAAKMGFQLRDGLAVQLTGKFDVYKASGKLSFVASKVEAAGEGDASFCGRLSAEMKASFDLGAEGFNTKIFMDIVNILEGIANE